MNWKNSTKVQSSWIAPSNTHPMLKINLEIPLSRETKHAYMVLNVLFRTYSTKPFNAQEWLIDFTLSNARRFYLSKGDPVGTKGLKNYLL